MNYTDLPPYSTLSKVYESLTKILYLGQSAKLGTKLLQSLGNSLKIGIFDSNNERLSLDDILLGLSTINFVTISRSLVAIAEDVKIQKFLSNIIYEARYTRLIYRASIADPTNSYGSKHDVARLQALRLDGSSSFLQVLPTAARFTFKNITMRTAIAFRLGIPLPSTYPLPKTCPHCSKPTDKFGRHFGLCKSKPILHAVHGAAVKSLHRLLPSGSDASLEVHGDTPETYNKRPLDLAYDMQDTKGRRAGVDFTIFQPSSASSHFIKGNPAKEMQCKEKMKINNLNGSVNPSAIDYFPLVLTTYGGLGPTAIKHFKELADGWYGYNPRLRKWALRNIKLSVSCSVQKRHAELIARRCDTASKMSNFSCSNPSLGFNVNHQRFHPIYQHPIIPSPIQPPEICI